MIRTLLKPLSFIPALLLMYMIFSFSSQTGEVSSQLSYKVSHKIVETVDYVFDGNLEDWEIDDWANRINFITRKLAHMTEYFALAVAVAFPLYVYGLHGIWLMLVAGIICVGFACGDEYHQAFVAGRSPSRRDVLIDSFGVFWGNRPGKNRRLDRKENDFPPKKKKKESYIQEEYYHEPKRSFFGRKKKAPMDYSASYRPEDYGPQVLDRNTDLGFPITLLNSRTVQEINTMPSHTSVLPPMRNQRNRRKSMVSLKKRSSPNQIIRLILRTVLILLRRSSLPTMGKLKIPTGVLPSRTA